MRYPILLNCASHSFPLVPVLFAPGSTRAVRLAENRQRSPPLGLIVALPGAASDSFAVAFPVIHLEPADWAVNEHWRHSTPPSRRRIGSAQPARRRPRPLDAHPVAQPVNQLLVRNLEMRLAPLRVAPEVVPGIVPAAANPVQRVALVDRHPRVCHRGPAQFEHVARPLDDVDALDLPAPSKPRTTQPNPRPVTSTRPEAARMNCRCFRSSHGKSFITTSPPFIIVSIVTQWSQVYGRAARACTTPSSPASPCQGFPAQLSPA